MRAKFIALTLSMLTPQSKCEYLWKMLVWCCFTTAIAFIAETALGTEISNPLHTYFAIVVVIAVPFFSVAMLAFNRMNDLQKELIQMASTDLLTGLNNRRAFFAQLDNTDGGYVALLDIDHFKRINDTYGHSSGDMALVVVANYLKEHLEDIGLVARVGGEEFAIFSKTQDEAAFVEILDKIVAGLQVDFGEADVFVTLSAGWAKAGKGSDITDLLHQADTALYAAKSSGRACQRKWSSAPPDLGHAPQNNVT